MHYGIKDESGREFYDAAVYAIVSRKTGRMYVGSSLFVKSRTRAHVAAIVNGTHPLPAVREHFKNHKARNVSVRIVERFEIPKGHPYEISQDHAMRPLKRRMLDREYEWAYRLNAINRVGRRLLFIEIRSDYAAA